MFYMLYGTCMNKYKFLLFAEKSMKDKEMYSVSSYISFMFEVN